MTALVAAVLAGTLVGGGSQETPREPPVFGVTIDTVKLDVSVARDGKLVTDLTADDFEVKDNGVVQDAELVSGDDRALQAVLVLDTSSSVAGERLQDLKNAASAFIAGLSPEDAVSVLAFSHQVYALPSDPYDHDALRVGIDWLTSGGATALNDAIVAGLLRSDTGRGRPMVLVFSDGRNTLSWLEARNVIAAAKEMDAVVYGIVSVNSHMVPTGRRRSKLPAHMDLLVELADLTGGTVLPTTGGDLGEAFHSILTTVQSRYVLRYVPRDVETAGWHSIRVRLKHAKGDVKVRSGYRRSLTTGTSR